MRVDLTNFRPRLFFFAAILLIAGGLSYLSGEAWLAGQLNEAAGPPKWLEAMRLEPGDAQYLEHLALYDEWNLTERNLPQAIRALRRAVELDPGNAELSMELAAADEQQGDSSGAKKAYEMAQQDFPVSPIVAWKYGSFLLRRGDSSDGFAELRQAMVNDPSLEASAISECWAVDPDASALADQLLPHKSDYYTRAIDYFLSQRQTDAAVVMWNRLLMLHRPMAIADATGLVDDLIGENRMSEAKRVWEEALRQSGWPHDAASDNSLIFNGGFEHNFANGGFDWRQLPIRGASYDFDSSIAHSGRRSLRIAFDGSANVNFQNIYQYAPVAPHRRYRFLAYLRTAGISTDSGIRFEIFDPRHPQEAPLFTPSLVGTNAWTPVQLDFESGRDTRLLEILLRRTPSTKFDNKLRGAAWIDDVSLVLIMDTTTANK